MSAWLKPSSHSVSLPPWRFPKEASLPSPSLGSDHCLKHGQSPLSVATGCIARLPKSASTATEFPRGVPERLDSPSSTSGHWNEASLNPSCISPSSVCWGSPGWRSPRAVPRPSSEWNREVLACGELTAGTTCQEEPERKCLRHRGPHRSLQHIFISFFQILKTI